MAKLGNIFDLDNDDDSSQQGGNRQNSNNRGNGGNNNGGNRPHQKPPKQMIYYYLIAALIIIALNFFFLPSMANRSIVEATYNEFVSQAEQGNIDQVVIDEEERTITFTLEGQNLTYRTGYISLDYELVPMLKHSGADFVSEIPTSINPIWLIIYNLLPFILLFGFGSWLSRRMQQSMASGGGMFGGLGKANAKVYEKDKTGVTFKDVAGEDEAKELLQDMVDFLHNPQKYKAIGATIPKGALLVGPPGTGKTLLAKAVAGEADVPFFSMSGSEFVELYVGMGAAKVRDLFKQAEQKAPCIIFIDEIDAIGKKRGNGAFGGNDEREQTLNQLLTEMDGFDGTKGIIVLAATNQPDSLDPALLRPGRFDRRVPVELPDMQGRVDILKVHAKDVKMAGNINFDAIAKACPGASGAELANMINEAAIRAVKAGRERVIQQDLEESIEVVLAGYKKKNKILTDKEKLIVAYHEVGHAMVAAKQDNSAPVHKITIVPRTSGALGYTMQVDEEGNHYLMSKEELENRIATMTGGRAAEELIFKSITTGAANDIEQATKLARAMISLYGMSDSFDMVALQQRANQYLGGDASLSCSEETLKRVDDEVIALVKKQHQKAYKILSDNIMKLHEIVKFLYEKETISGEEFMQILNSSENAIEEQARQTEAQQKALHETEDNEGKAE
ncbi:MAG TPA: ATP-dependent zinc metalloprotease FtsH [Candidatus Avilachnospira avistercoris]|nr:ATP-dependent zinc metalloprotease FtsH [Candidatus Avilachnospira avistercoris]